MTRFATLLLAVISLVFFVSTRDASAEDGKQLFLKYECNECHTVAALGIDLLPATEDEEEEEDDLDLDEEEEEEEPPDLSGVGKRHPRDFFAKFLRKQIKNEDGKKHRKRFKGSDAEMDALVAFLTSLDKDAPTK